LLEHLIMNGFKSIVLLCFLLGTITTYAQRGKIIVKASASGRAVMDPNLDDYVSDPANNPPGFTNNGLYFVDEFEIPMFGIPKLGGDVAGDNVGKKCGITDLIPDSLGYSVYAVRDDNDNLIFRFRVGDDNSSVEAYTILLDVDNLFGTADPNYTPDNPGFEIDITLIKNSNNKGIYVYNIDGVDNCPAQIAFYPIGDYFQVSIADEVTCGDEDFFYDFFVPFQAIANAYNASNCPTCINIDPNTGLRYAAVTNTSATCAMGGKIADISGVDNDAPEYDGCDLCAFIDLVENQCPTPIADLEEDGAGFEKEKVTRPTINLPIRAGQDSVSGTTVEANIYVKLLIYGNIGTETSPAWSSTPREAYEGYADGNIWSFTLNTRLQAFDSIVARTQLTQSSVPCGGAGNNTSSTSVTIVTPNDKPVALRQELTTPEDTQVTFTLTGSDPDNDPITFSIVPNTGPYHGSLSGSGSSWTYTPFTNYFGEDSVYFKVSDGIYDSINAIQITVTPVNDAPVVTGSSGSVLYSIIQSSIIIDNAINVTDVDDVNIESATVSISANFISTQDILLFTNTPKISGSYSSSTGVLTLTGTATKAEYSAALASVQYRNSSNQPNLTQRTVSFVVNDGNLNSAPFNRIIIFNISNYPPVITDNNGQLSYTTPEDTPLTNQCLTVTDVEGHTVSISQATSLTNHGATTFTGLCFTFTPVSNFNGEERVRILVCDNGTPSMCDTVLVIINVTPVNDIPVAVNDVATTAEDTPLTLNILSNDTDVENALDPATVQFSSTTIAGQGTFTYNGNGSVTFTPVANYVGTSTTNYTVKDAAGAISNSASITITVTPLNDAPIATDDSYQTQEDTQLTGNLISNDTDVDQDVLSITQFTVPGDVTVYTAGQTATVTGIGTITINSNGGFVFNPALNYFNAAPVLVATYTLSDSKGGSDQATVSIRVTPVNDNPIGTNDTGASNNIFSTPENTSITLANNANVLDNDTDPDGDVLRVTQFVVSAVTYPVSSGSSNSTALSGIGTVTIHSNGDLEFVPVTDYNGTVPTITYSVSDGNGGVATATVVIIVTPVNSAPIAVDDSFVTSEDNALNTGNVLSNDSDPEGNTLVVTQFVVSGSGTVAAGNTGTITGIGTLIINANGTFTFTPALNYSNTGAVIIATYTVSDGNGGTDNATVSIQVTPVNDNPIGGNDTGADAFTTLEDTPITLSDNANVLDNDIDPDGDPVSVTQFVINATNYNITPGSFATATLTGVGTVIIHSNGDVEYSPTLNFNGNVPLITYTITDGNGTSTATARITVTPVNDAPIATNDNFSTLQNVALNNNVLTNDTDVDGQTLTVSQFIVAGDGTIYTAGATATITGMGSLVISSNGAIAFTPDPTFTGTVPTITYTMSDGNGGSDNAQVVIEVVTSIDYPIAANDNFSTPEDVSLNGVNILTNDQTEIGNTLTVTQYVVAGNATVFTAGQNAVISGIGTLNINGAGALIFTPVANYHGSVPLITYTADDGSGSATASITITINAVDDVLVAVDDSYTMTEDGSLSNNVVSNDIDVDDDGLTVTQFTVSGSGTIAAGNTGIVTGVGSLIINANGSFVFTPNLNYNNLSPVFVATYTISDGTTTDQATISIQVTPVNDNPVGGNDTGADAFTTLEDTPIQLSDNANVLDNDTDPDGGALRVTQFVWNGITHTVGAGSSTTASISNVGSVTIHSNGDLEFVPVLNFNGNVPLITYTISNTNLGTATAQARIVVTPANDTPVAVDDSFTTTEDATLNNSVLSNDTDVDGNNLTVTQFVVSGSGTVTAGNAGIITGVGSLTINTDGTVTFIPSANYNNVNPVLVATYTITDGTVTDEATVSIRVTPVNDTPNGASETGTDSFVTQEEDPIELSENANVLANDTDPENNTLSVTEFTVNGINYTITPGSSNTATLEAIGTITLHSNGALEFVPAENFFGNVPAIIYTVSDGTAPTTATAQIVVTGVNDIPFAVNDENYSTPEDTNLNENVLSNDYDVDADNLTVSQFVVVGSTVPVLAGNTTTVAGIGTLLINSDGSLAFTPIPNYNNASPVLTATYTITDGTVTDEATVSIRVTPVNDNPVSGNDTGTSNDKFSTPEDTPIALTNGANVLTNDIDPDGDVLSVSQFSIGITSYTVPSGGNISATIAGAGNLTLYSTGELTFTPALNFTGNVPIITYSISDGKGGTSSATVALVVTPQNDPPQAEIIDDDLSQAEDTPLVICIAVEDVEGDDISVDGITGVIQTSTETGSTLIVTSVSNTQVCVLFTPGANFNGDSEWAVTICDNGNPTACTTIPVVITVTPQNDAPVAVNDQANANEDEVKVLNILANDSDVDTATDPANTINPTTVDLDPSTPAEEKSILVINKGTFAVNNSGSVTFTPVLNYPGPAVSINYTVKDFGGLASNIASITINVTPANDAPIITEFPAELDSIPEDSVLRVSRYAFDPDGDSFTWEITNISGGGQMPNDPDPDFAAFSYRFTPPLNYNGRSVWQLKACDTQGACSIVEFVIPIKPVNDPPVAVDDFVETPAGALVQVDALANDLVILAPFSEFYDVYIALDSVDNLELVNLEEIVGGTATIQNNLIHFTPDLSYVNQTGSVKYWIKDSGGLVASAVVHLDIGPAGFHIYEGLSPNGDDKNDFWRISGIEQDPNNTVRVFDRFNNLVFETRGYSNVDNYWYGQANHGVSRANLPEGTYYYTITVDLQEDNQGERLFKGFVILKRN
jgi:gliding motility-associated-like protein